MSLPPKYTHILYATDIGRYTRPVFRNAVALAIATGARITMLHVVEPLGNTGRAVIGAYLPDVDVHTIERDALKEILATMHKRLTKFCAEEMSANQQNESEIVEALEVATGLPSEEIIRTAENRHVDLIVMGTCTHSLMGRASVGSTARKVIQHSHIPVLIVPNLVH
ncbi:universal stress protein [Imhoffiella purpurea]|uniref:Universal stress protein n=1 Tax=Imhoffiella purpurea TaxID=1249627 RepID=W9V553_9GAMM|nr:universal stress protein [Imhoffiella purpurea]EXJ14678.1 Universal stress protein family [Imhoffiella purpurea]